VRLAPVSGRPLGDEAMIPAKGSTTRFGFSYLLNIFSVTAVGITFVLFLVLFVLTPTRRYGTVDRPEGPTASATESSEFDIYVVIHADSRIRVGPQFVSDSELLPLLREIQARAPRRLKLEADRHASYDAVQKVVRAAREAGFSEIQMLTGPHDVLEALQREAKKAPNGR
jgi:biopolymer transport protein ExbD